MTKKFIKDHLLMAGVKNLINFGYPNVTVENILTDGIYKSMFKNMLNENLGADSDIDLVINELLIEINL